MRTLSRLQVQAGVPRFPVPGDGHVRVQLRSRGASYNSLEGSEKGAGREPGPPG